jgi:hypothetical protein
MCANGGSAARAALGSATARATASTGRDGRADKLGVARTSTGAASGKTTSALAGMGVDTGRDAATAGNVVSAVSESRGPGAAGRSTNGRARTALRSAGNMLAGAGGGIGSASELGGSVAAGASDG